MNVAYADRDIKNIRRKTRINFLFLAARMIMRKITGSDKKTVRNILVYPPVKSVEEAGDIANRISWGVPNKKVTTYIPVEGITLPIDTSELSCPLSQKNFLKAPANIVFIKASESRTINPDLFMIHKMDQCKGLVIGHISKIETADPVYFSSMEALVWQFTHFKTLDRAEIEEIDSLSERNFLSFKNSQKGKRKGYCFVSGPSFDQYKDFRFESDSVRVICNSIVKNHEFLDYIGKPDIVVFADPVFHFSPCKYSAEFREQMVDVVKKYDCYVATSFQSVPLLLAHFPELRNKIIGIRMDKRIPVNFPDAGDLKVKSVNNILTLLMLPIASSLCSEIAVIGADGRKPDEKYFWKHSSSVQLDDLMQSAFDTHPSFFRDRDYADYYEEHCDYLEHLIQYGESKGKKYCSLTTSYIPAFQKRLCKS